MVRGWLLWSLAALLLVPAGAQAQVNHWSDGDVRIRLLNPSLQPEGGTVQVSGDFFGQVALEGNDTDQVAELGFSFGAGPPAPEHTPVFTGLQDFRSDAEATDGWILPISASDTPSGDYKFAIHAYTTAGDPSTEVARLWGQASLDNENDATPPWPWILPGETGELQNPHGVDGVTVEFAENATAELFVDGQRVALEAWTPPARDNDNVPRQTVETSVLGSGYQWAGTVEAGDVLRVEAMDEAGNNVSKAVVVGHGADMPAIEVVPEGGLPSVTPGQTVSLRFEVRNVGSQDTEVDLQVVGPESWDVVPGNESFQVPAGASKPLSLTASVPENAEAGQGMFALYPLYGTGNATVNGFVRYAVPVSQGLTEAAADAGGQGSNGGDEQASGVPAPALAAPLALAAVALAAARRRGHL